MERVLIAVGIAVAVAVLAWALERRRPQAPTQRRWAVPDQLDRADFDRSGAPWLVAVFSSETCDSCRAAVERARLLASADVAVQEIEVAVRGDLHRRYNVEAVPTLVVADRQGVVRASIVGPPAEHELEEALTEVLGN
jgi:protein-disulfide isomerase